MPAFLVVEDDDALQRSVARHLKPYGDSVFVSTCAESLRLLRERVWTGVVIDIGLPDGSGLDVLRRFRKRDSWTRVLVTTAAPDDERARESQLLGAEYLPKPLDVEHLGGFAERAVRDGTSGFSEVIVSMKLTDAEAEILNEALRGTHRCDLPAAVGSSPSTVERHMTSLLQKAHDAGFDGERFEYLVCDILRRVLS